MIDFNIAKITNKVKLSDLSTLKTIEWKNNSVMMMDHPSFQMNLYA